jgi:tRNA pseudouridine38-40 synthase
MNHFRAQIAYDGTHYFGWQTTKTGPSIQEHLSKALFACTQENAIPEAASRTDRGVHAEGQTIAFALSKQWKPSQLLQAINAHLPKDIRVYTLDETSQDFHPTLHALEKEYHYTLSNTPFQHPIDRLYAWHVHTPLDVTLMQQGALALQGTHSFASFTSGPFKDPICTVSKILFTTEDRGRLRIALHGNRFLYKMARTIVGTLVYIGAGKRSVESVPKLLTSKNRPQSGMTAPAHGLRLYKVLY